MGNSFHTIKPSTQELRKYISYYYFHSSDEPGEVNTFLYYPHYKNALSIYKDSVVEMNGAFSTRAKPKKGQYFFGYTKLIRHAASAELQSPFLKIGIVFEPLGLNYFLPKNLAGYLNGVINLKFDFFKESMIPTLDEVFKKESLSEKGQVLDDYFKTMFLGFDDEVMVKAMEYIFSTKDHLKVELLASELGVHRKTLLRKFKQHLNCSVIDYINLIRFRQAVEVYNTSGKSGSLTELAHESMYYDQSEFIHSMKKLTGFKPKTFFKNLNDIGNQGTFWTFEDK